VTTFGIHVDQAIPNKHIRLTTTSNDIFMGMPALFNCCYTSTSIEDPYESDNMALQETTSLEVILLNTLAASSMLPHLAYMSTRLLLTKMSDSQPLSTICL
jgi:hypothetical protein